jgi:hypothetical protein
LKKRKAITPGNFFDGLFVKAVTFVTSFGQHVTAIFISQCHSLSLNPTLSELDA